MATGGRQDYLPCLLRDRFTAPLPKSAKIREDGRDHFSMRRATAKELVLHHARISLGERQRRPWGLLVVPKVQMCKEHGLSNLTNSV